MMTAILSVLIAIPAIMGGGGSQQPTHAQYQALDKAIMTLHSVIMTQDSVKSDVIKPAEPIKTKTAGGTSA